MPTATLGTFLTSRYTINNDLTLVQDQGSLIWADSTYTLGVYQPTPSIATLEIAGAVHNIQQDAFVIRTDGDDIVRIAATGVVMGHELGSDAIVLLGGGNELVVAGYVNGYDYGIYSNPLESEDADTITIEATGHVIGNRNSSDQRAAVRTSQENSISELTNHGTIEGFSYLGYQVAISNAPWRTNSPVDIDQTYVSHLRLQNTGTIIGDIQAGAGDDHIYNSGSIEGWVSLGYDNDLYDGGDGSLIGPLFGGPGNDSLYGGADDERFFGSLDNDIIMGRGGDDSLEGGSGNDTLRGGAGNDTIYSDSGFDLVFGGSGNDRLIGSSESDTLYGDSGNDTILDFAGNDTLDGGSGHDDIRSGENDDHIIGGPGNDILRGEDHNDTIEGGSGVDTIAGGVGNDSLNGGSGNDRVFGGAGADTIQGGTGSDHIEGGTQDDDIRGGSQNDNICGDSGNDVLRGEGGDDNITGGAGNDTIAGGTGSDTLVGGAADDRLFGGHDDDRLSGGDGQDLLNGGDGQDLLNGGDGADTFVFNDVSDSAHGGTRDTIADFTTGTDTIDLSEFSGTLTFITSYTGSAGEVRYNDAVGRLYVDIDGDLASDFSVDLGAGAGLTAGDLIL